MHRRISQLDIYLVGGAVRDELLGRPIKERDWVIVGATPEDLIALSFQPVGKDFPVFLHPETHEEYALARTERKTSKGYKGFKFYAAPDVSLKEDLKRRDLTINAIAKAPDGTLIDPYHGQSDIRDHWLRHVSPAFAEDPVRILRIARFASTLPNFNVHPDTNLLMVEMVKTGEVDALVAERVWKEFSRTLETNAPHRFFEVLATCNALHILFPEFINNPQSINALQRAVTASSSGIIRFASLLHALPSKSIQYLCRRYRAPNDYSALALLVAKNIEHYKLLDTHDSNAILKLLRITDAFRRKERFSQFLTVCDIVLAQESKQVILIKALEAANTVDTTILQEKNLVGSAFGEAVYQLQLDAIQTTLEK